ncbi:MAG: 2-C-methyl-D-erythritol 4-phosphate cytidylyltransferase [Burkholderiaceae bacterium]|nr:2-C-methyl-D-erythritol 4-phosphate cytidylyltransferase [Burkholderiaceae bacterium]
MPTAPSPTKSPQIWALIPCGGSGTRAGAGTPKQYRVIAGKPMVMHTLAAFSAVSRLAGVVVATAVDDAVLSDLFFDPFFIAAQAGNTRADTVFNGLNRLVEHGAAPADWVLVHDAARCLITSEQINALIDACQEDAVGGLLALPLSDTLKREHSGRVADTLDRDDKWLAQTPQMFRIGALLNALDVAGDLSTSFLTDESSAMERLGLAPKLVRGSAQNFKVTYPEDFALAEAVLLGRSQAS